MPRNVRNFWIETTIDGRKSRMSGGPVRKDGGFECTIYIRDKGNVITALEIRGYETCGDLKLWVRNPNKPEDRLEYVTER